MDPSSTRRAPVTPHPVPTWHRLVLATLLAWGLLVVPGVYGWRRGAVEDEQASFLSFAAPFQGFVGLVAGAVVLQVVWFLLRRRLPLRAPWAAACLVLTTVAYLLANALVQPDSLVLWSLVPLVACAVTSLLFARSHDRWASTVLVGVVVACTAVLLVNHALVQRRHAAERLAHWQAAAPRFWVPDSGTVTSCHGLDGRVGWSWIPPEGMLWITAHQDPSSAPAKAATVVATSPLVVHVETGGERIRLSGDGASRDQLLAVGRSLHAVDGQWMAEHCG